MDTFNDFLVTVEPRHQEFAKAIHERLVENNFKVKIENKASGFFVSYSHPKTKRSLLNFLFRKSGMLARIYPNRINTEVPGSLTETMKEEIEKAPDCKRCSDKCPTGYKFSIKDKTYDKCRYNAFLFSVTEESKGILTEWAQREIGENG